MRRDGSPALLVHIARLLRSGDYQLVHSHLVHADWHTAVAAAAAPGVPLVSTKHNDDPFRRTYPFRVVERAMSNRCVATITISEALRDFTLRYSPPRTEVATVLYGLAVPPQAPERGPEFDQPTLLTVARLVRQKGLDILIRAMGPIRESVPGTGLLIAGDGPERSALERLARELGVEESVSFLGHRADVDQLMRRAWLLVHPARWEGFGLVLLEAMRQGLPVVAARVSAIPEIVVDGFRGPPGAARGHARACRRGDRSAGRPAVQARRRRARLRAARGALRGRADGSRDGGDLRPRDRPGRSPAEVARLTRYIPPAR